MEVSCIINSKAKGNEDPEIVNATQQRNDYITSKKLDNQQVCTQDISSNPAPWMKQASLSHVNVKAHTVKKEHTLGKAQCIHVWAP